MWQEDRKCFWEEEFHRIWCYMSRRELTGPAYPIFHAGELPPEIWFKWKYTGDSLFLCSSLARLLQFRHKLDKHLELRFLFQLKLEVAQCLPGQCSSLPLKLLLSDRKRHSGLKGSRVCLQSGRGHLSKSSIF